MNNAPMPLLERLELAAQACHAAQLLSVEKTCRDAIAALSATERTISDEDMELLKNVSRKLHNALACANTMTEEGRKEGYALLIQYQAFLRDISSTTDGGSHGK